MSDSNLTTEQVSTHDLDHTPSSVDVVPDVVTTEKPPASTKRKDQNKPKAPKPKVNRKPAQRPPPWVVAKVSRLTWILRNFSNGFADVMSDGFAREDIVWVLNVADLSIGGIRDVRSNVEDRAKLIFILTKKWTKAMWRNPTVSLETISVLSPVILFIEGMVNSMLLATNGTNIDTSALVDKFFIPFGVEAARAGNV